MKIFAFEAERRKVQYSLLLSNLIKSRESLDMKADLVIMKSMKLFYANINMKRFSTHFLFHFRWEKYQGNDEWYACIPIKTKIYIL